MTLRILALNWRDIRSPEAGGSEIHLHEVLTRLVERGHQVTLVCSQFTEEAGAVEEEVDGIRTIRTGRWWNAHWSVPKRARELLTEEAFDVLLDDVNKIPFFAPRFSPVPVVAIFHHLLGRSVFLETNPLSALAIQWYESRIGKVYGKTPALCVSPSTERELLSRGLLRENLSVVPPGLDPIHRAGAEGKAQRPLLVCVSRLKRYKRLDLAIRAAKLVSEGVPDLRLVIVGEGSDRPRLEKLVDRLQAPVIFAGAVSQEDKVRWLNRAHMVLAPSMKEGWGMVCVEAMACGTPVIASHVEGHQDSVPKDVGFLALPWSAASFANLVRLVLCAPNVVERCIQNGLAWSRRFRWEHVADAVENLLLEAAGRPQRPSSHPHSERTPSPRRRKPAQASQNAEGVA